MRREFYIKLCIKESCHRTIYIQEAGRMNVLVMNCSPVRNGATAEIANIACNNLREKYAVRNVCIDDYDFQFCKGCRSCHNTAKCIQKDDVAKIIEQHDIGENRDTIFIEKDFDIIFV